MECLCDKTFTCSVCQDKANSKTKTIATFTAGVLAAVVLSNGLAFASTKYDLVYLRNGKTVSAEQGILAAASGETVYKCQTVEAKVSKSGTSVSLHAIKKPKTKEQIDQAIEELKKQQE